MLKLGIQKGDTLKDQQLCWQQNKKNYWNFFADMTGYFKKCIEIFRANCLFLQGWDYHFYIDNVVRNQIEKPLIVNWNSLVIKSISLARKIVKQYTALPYQELAVVNVGSLLNDWEWVVWQLSRRSEVRWSRYLCC